MKQEPTPAQKLKLELNRRYGKYAHGFTYTDTDSLSEPDSE